MKNLYGYKESEIKEFLDYLAVNKDKKPLATIFEEFAAAKGKAKGTIRNMYYSVAKKANSDHEFSKEYLGGKSLSVGKIIEFDRGEERKLVKAILLGKKNGKSARCVINELAGGDSKLALRYQNKYRNVLKNNLKLVSELVAEIRKEDGETYDPFEMKKARTVISEFQLKRLQCEINALINKISGKIKQENEELKTKLSALTMENMKLKNILYGDQRLSKAKNYFTNEI